jgi:hypothetical protein
MCHNFFEQLLVVCLDNALVEESWVVVNYDSRFYRNMPVIIYSRFYDYFLEKLKKNSLGFVGRLDIVFLPRRRLCWLKKFLYACQKTFTQPPILV